MRTRINTINFSSFESKLNSRFLSSIFSFILFVLCACSEEGNFSDPPEIHEVEFTEIDTLEPDSVRILKSLKRDGDLFMITYYGDYQSRLDCLNRRVVTYGIGSVIPAVNYKCSMYATSGDPDYTLLGRNLDNYGIRGVLMGMYAPANGYSSLAVSNLSDMGFSGTDDPTTLSITDRQILLNCVLFAADGMNENGVSVALASVEDSRIMRDQKKKLVCISYIIREILDHAGSLEEAIEIVSKHNVFDKDTATLSHHLLLADDSGSSVIAEYSEGDWRFISNDTYWQIATNTSVLNRTEEWKRDQCDRYEAGDDFLIRYE